MNAGGRQKAGAVLLTLIGITAIFLLLSFSLKTMGNNEAQSEKAVALTNIRETMKWRRCSKMPFPK